MLTVRKPSYLSTMTTTRNFVPTWTVPDDGTVYTAGALKSTAWKLAEVNLAEGEKILSVDDQPARNRLMSADVNGRLVDPVAEKVWICSALVVIEKTEPEVESV